MHAVNQQGREQGREQAESFHYQWVACIRQSDLPHSSRHVALDLFFYLSKGKRRVFPSNATLAENTGLSVRSIRNHLQALRGAGWLEIVREGGCYGGKNCSTIHEITIPPAVRESMKTRGAESAAPTQDGGQILHKTGGSSFHDGGQILPPVGQILHDGGQILQDGGQNLPPKYLKEDLKEKYIKSFDAGEEEPKRTQPRVNQNQSKTSRIDRAYQQTHKPKSQHAQRLLPVEPTQETESSWFNLTEDDLQGAFIKKHTDRTWREGL